MRLCFTAEARLTHVTDTGDERESEWLKGGGTKVRK